MPQQTPPLRFALDLSVPYSSAVRVAREMLERSFEARRDPARFTTTPLQGEGPDADWGVAAQIVEGALTQLNEGLPNGNLKRVELALGALSIGQSLLTKALARRGVYPSQLAMDPEEAPKL